MKEIPLIHTTSLCNKLKSPIHPQCNTESTRYDESTYGRQWLKNINGPFVNGKYLLDGSLRSVTKHNHCKLNLLSSVIPDSIIINPDYLTMYLSLSQTSPRPAAGDLPREAAVVTEEEAVAEVADLKVSALLDSGSLAGDFISQRVVDKLNASTYVTYINTTVCSGFAHKCSHKFPPIYLSIQYINEIPFNQEIFP